jgi:hypothetical protein
MHRVDPRLGPMYRLALAAKTAPPAHTPVDATSTFTAGAGSPFVERGSGAFSKSTFGSSSWTAGCVVLAGHGAHADSCYSLSAGPPSRPNSFFATPLAGASSKSGIFAGTIPPTTTDTSSGLFSRFVRFIDDIPFTEVYLLARLLQPSCLRVACLRPSSRPQALAQARVQASAEAQRRRHHPQRRALQGRLVFIAVHPWVLVPSCARPRLIPGELFLRYLLSG